MNKLKLIIYLSVLLFSGSVLAKVIYVSDLNGRNDGIRAQIDAGNLRLTKDGRLEIVNKKDEFVFGGNVSGQGIEAIRARQLMMDLKSRHADRVSLIMGNSDLNKIAIPNAIKELGKLKDPGYKRWLEEQVQKKYELPKSSSERDQLLRGQNTELRRLSYWFETHKTPGSLEKHRLELKEIRGKEVALEEAADDFIRSVKPGGEHYRFLEMGQRAAVLENSIFVRGGVDERSLNIVKGAKAHSNARDWVKSLNKSYQLDLAKGHFVEASETSSLTRLPDKVSDYLRGSGIATEVVGGSGSTTPLLTKEFLRFTPDEATAVVVDKGEIRVVDKNLSGRQIQYKIGPRSNEVADNIGKAAKLKGGQDEYTIVGQDENSGTYILKKYYDGHQLDEKIVSRDELRRDYEIQPRVQGDRRDLAYRKKLKDELETKVPVLGPQELFDGGFGKKAPLVITGSLESGTAQSTKIAFEKLAETLDPNKVIVVTDGMDRGVAQIASEVFGRKNFVTVGFVKEGVEPREINPNLKGIVLAGPGRENPLELGLSYAKAREGSVIFVGNDGKKEVEKANQIGVNNHVFGKGKIADNDLIARAHPDWVKGSREALIKKIKDKDIKLVEYEKLLEASRGLKVTILGGLTDLNYENPAAVKKYVKDLVKANGDKAMYVLDGTSEGIGEAYEWIPKFAKELGYSNVKTAGIYSEKTLKTDIAKQDYIVLDSGDSDSPSKKVEMAKDSRGKIVVLNGDDKMAAQIQTAVENKVPVTLVSDPKIDSIKSNIDHEGVEKFKRRPAGTYGTLELTDSSTKMAASVQKNLLPSQGAQELRVVASKDEPAPLAVGETAEPPKGSTASRKTVAQPTPPPTPADAGAVRESPSTSEPPAKPGAVVAESKALEQRSHAPPATETSNPKGGPTKGENPAVTADLQKDSSSGKDHSIEKVKKDAGAHPSDSPERTRDSDQNSRKSATESKSNEVVGGASGKAAHSTPTTMGGSTTTVVVKESSSGFKNSVAPSSKTDNQKIKVVPGTGIPISVDPACIDKVMRALVR